MFSIISRLFSNRKIKWFHGQYGAIVSGVNGNNHRTIAAFYEYMSKWSKSQIRKSGVQVLTYAHWEDVGAAVICNEVVTEPILLINVGFLQCMYLQNGMSAARAAMDILVSHELCHLEQIRSGKLKMFTNGSVIWEGVEYQAVPIQHTKKYIEQPWEKEATEAGIRRSVELGIAPSVEEGWRAVMVGAR